MSKTNKITLLVFSILMLIIVSYGINQYFYPKIVEGNVEDDINRAMNVVKEEAEKAANLIKRETEKAFNKLGNMIKEGFEKMFKPLIDAFDNLANRGKNLGYGIQNCNRGLKMSFEAIGFMFKTGGEDVGNLMTQLKYAPPYIKSAFEMESANIGSAIKKSDDDINNLFTALKTPFDPYLVDSRPLTDAQGDHPYADGVFDRTYRYTVFQMGCARKRTINFAPCFFYYFLHAIGAAMNYVFVVGPIELVKLITKGYDITCFYDRFFDGVDCIDRFWLGFSGYHLFHYSDYILNKCYYCDGMPHKSINDNSVDPNPKQPVLKPPDFPRDLKNAADELKHDYDPDNGKIPMRLKMMGRFLGNDTKSLEDNPWIISEGIDSSITSNFNQASADLKHLSDASDKMVNDFNVVIPSKFADADKLFEKGGREINAAFSP